MTDKGTVASGPSIPATGTLVAPASPPWQRPRAGDGTAAIPPQAKGPARVNRILFVEANEDDTVGGSHVCLYDLATNLDRSRFQPVVVFYQENRYVEELQSLGIEVHVWDGVRSRERLIYQRRSFLSKLYLHAEAVLRRALFLRRHRISLIHLNNAMTSGFDDWLPAARATGIPCISHTRGEGPRPQRRIFRWLMTRFDRVIAISDSVGTQVRDAGVPPSRVRRVYDSIDVSAFLNRVNRPAADIRSELGVGSDTVLVVMVAHLRGWKGQDVALAGLALMDPEIRRRMHLLLVGGTPKIDQSYAENLHVTIARHELYRAVTFLGERPDVPDLTNAADVMLHAATRPEPFGLVLLEAMAMGKPLVASNRGGPVEIVTAESGLLFDAGNPADLARCLERLVTDGELRRSLGAGALRRVRDFSLARTIEGVQGVYHELLGPPLPRPASGAVEWRGRVDSGDAHTAALEPDASHEQQGETAISGLKDGPPVVGGLTTTVSTPAERRFGSVQAGRAHAAGSAGRSRPSAMPLDREPRRVLYVEANEDATVGGSHLSLFNLVRNLDRAQYQPVVLYYQDNPYVDQLRGLGIEVHVWEDVRRQEQRIYQPGSLIAKTRLQLAAVSRRAAFVRQHQIDLVHLNNAMTTGFDDWLPGAHRAGVPCVSHARGQGPLPRRLIFRWLLTRYDRVIAISNFIAEVVAESGISRDRVRRVYNAIDVEAFRKKVRRPAAEVRRELGVTPDSLLAVMVGHLRTWKGQDAVLAALHHMDPPKRARLHIAFVGGTPAQDLGYERTLHETVSREGLAANVSFLGERADVPDLTNASDITLHASTKPEPFGLVLLEGMALGKPLIASALGGPLEIVTPESGLLFDPAKPEELARILERLVAEPKLRLELGEGALRRVRDFTLERTVAGVQAVYAELFAQSSQSGSGSRRR